MKRNRLLVSLLLALVLALAIAAPASAIEFTDVEDTDFEASITALTYREFMGGYLDGTFRPDNPLQRQQFAKMAVLTMGYEVTAADVSTFTDTPDPYDAVNNPLYPGSFAAVAAENEIMIGRPGNTFDFTGYVTRQQVISVVVRAAGDTLATPPAELGGRALLRQPVARREHQDRRVQRSAGRHPRSGHLGHHRQCHSWRSGRAPCPALLSHR